MEERKLIQHNGFSVASLIFGLLAFLTSFLVVFVPFNSGLAFTFAFLSRGDRRMSTEAKLGIVFAVLGIAAALFISAAAFTFVSRYAVPDIYGTLRGAGLPGGILR